MARPVRCGLVVTWLPANPWRSNGSGLGPASSTGNGCERKERCSRRSGIRTSSGCAAYSRPPTGQCWCSISRPRGASRSCSPIGTGCGPARSSPSSPRWRARSRRRTRQGSCTATSRPATCCSTPLAARCSPISAPPGWPATAHPRTARRGTSIPRCGLAPCRRRPPTCTPSGQSPPARSRDGRSPRPTTPYGGGPTTRTRSVCRPRWSWPCVRRSTATLSAGRTPAPSPLGCAPQRPPNR